MEIKSKKNSKNIIIIISRIFFKFLKWVSFGKIDMRYDERTTTQGSIVYTGTKWAEKDVLAKERELHHEEEHVRQWETWSFLYSISYVINIWTILFPALAIVFGFNFIGVFISIIVGTVLPAGASLRAYWEYKAFEQTLLTMKKQNLDKQFKRSDLVLYYTELLTGTSYYFAASFLEGFVYARWEKFMDKNKIGL